jgi:hypothetical protein
VKSSSCGTDYLQFSGPTPQRAMDLQIQTLELMEILTGKTYGTWLWSEIGPCALAAG